MNTSTTMSPLKVAAVLLSLLWLGYIAVEAWQRWPQVPLDVGADDGATASIYRDAVAAHAGRAVALALSVPALLWVVVRLLRRRPH